MVNPHLIDVLENMDFCLYGFVGVFLVVFFVCLVVFFFFCKCWCSWLRAIQKKKQLKPFVPNFILKIREDPNSPEYVIMYSVSVFFFFFFQFLTAF